MTKLGDIKWDKQESTKKPLGDGDKQTMVEYYEAGLKTGKRSEDLLTELAERYGRSPRQISRYVSEARESGKPYQETPHKQATQGHRQAVRKITLRLKEELTVGLPGTNMERPHLQRLSDGKFELRLEVEDDPLFEAFKGHPPSDTFFEKFARWKQLVAGSWQAYDALNGELMDRIETIARKWLGPNPWGIWVNDEPKLMPSFLLIILRDIVKYALAREQSGNQPQPVIKLDDYYTETLRSGLVSIWSPYGIVGITKTEDVAMCPAMHELLLKEYLERPQTQELARKRIGAEELRATMSREIDEAIYRGTFSGKCHFCPS